MEQVRNQGWFGLPILPNNTTSSWGFKSQNVRVCRIQRPRKCACVSENHPDTNNASTGIRVKNTRCVEWWRPRAQTESYAEGRISHHTPTHHKSHPLFVECNTAVPTAFGASHSTTIPVDYCCAVGTLSCAAGKKRCYPCATSTETATRRANACKRSAVGRSNFNALPALMATSLGFLLRPRHTPAGLRSGLLALVDAVAFGVRAAAVTGDTCAVSGKDTSLHAGLRGCQHQRRCRYEHRTFRDRDDVGLCVPSLAEAEEVQHLRELLRKFDAATESHRIQSPG